VVERDRADRPAQELDAVDKAIIRRLQSDGRMPYAQLGPLVGLSQAAVRQRVNRLIESGVMQVVAVTDPRRLGLEVQAMVAVGVAGDVRKVAAELAALDDIDYVVIVAGRYDILCEVVCADSDALLDLINDRIRRIDGVDHTEVLSYLRLVKQTYNWGTG
jgi:Lrp/AsnC family transcriptional regulator for asnA, asnC and gidA